MKLTTLKLKKLINEVLQEEGKKERIMKMLRGQDPQVQTVAIMSGQNPMASAVGAGVNDQLQSGLESDLRQMGYQFERIGGIFEGHTEKSVIIKNARLEDMDELNRKYKQWGFVFGRKQFDPSRDAEGGLSMDPEGGLAGEYSMEFQMYKMDHDDDHGFGADEWSSATSDVMDSDDLRTVDDNYSYIPGMGEEGKILIPLYGKPEIPMSDQEIEDIVSSMGSPSEFAGYRKRRSWEDR